MEKYFFKFYESKRLIEILIYWVIFIYYYKPNKNYKFNNKDRIDTTVVYKNNLTEIKFPLDSIIINNNTIVNSKNIYNNNKNLYYNKS